MRRRRAIGDLIVLVLLLAYAVPFFWQVLTSFKPDSELLRLPPLLPSHLTLAHYGAVLGHSLMPRALVNSLGIAALTTLLALVLSLPGGYALARLPIPAKGTLLLGMVACTAFPQIATVGPLYLLLRALALRDTWAALILAHTSFVLPLMLWLLSGFVREIPGEIEDAAMMDGASRFQLLRWIVLPLLAPGLAAAALLAFLFSWNEFLFALTLTSTAEATTIPVGVAKFSQEFAILYGEMSAASILASIPALIFVAVAQKQLVKGLTLGAVKG